MPTFRLYHRTNLGYGLNRAVVADHIDIQEGVVAFSVGAKPVLILPVHEVVCIERESD
jgi:hypothetical protein